MFSMIKHYFSPVTAKTKLRSQYTEQFQKAKQFTIAQGFPLDSISSATSKKQVNALLLELQIAVTEFLQTLFVQNCILKNRPIYSFGGECLSVHNSLMEFIKLHYSNVDANLTIGRLDYLEEIHFDFSIEKFKKWQLTPPTLLQDNDCHVWITIDEKYILDATAQTYLNTRIGEHNNDTLGGILFGEVGNFSCLPLKGIHNESICSANGLNYVPIAIGTSTLKAIAAYKPI